MNYNITALRAFLSLSPFSSLGAASLIDEVDLSFFTLLCGGACLAARHAQRERRAVWLRRQVGEKIRKEKFEGGKSYSPFHLFDYTNLLKITSENALML